MACLALVSSVLMSASLASAAKPSDHAKAGKGAIARACAAEKKADKAAFKATYGKQAMRNCIKGVSEGDGAAAADDSSSSGGEAKNPAKACRAERDADPDGFRADYGTNRNGKNAFGKCVSAKAQASAEDDEDETGDDSGDVDDGDSGEDVPDEVPVA